MEPRQFTSSDQAEAKVYSLSPQYLPTPEEIAAACRAIQSEWTETERLTRKMSSKVSSTSGDTSPQPHT